MSDKEFPSAFAEFINGLDIDDFDGKKNSQRTGAIKEELASPKDWVVVRLRKMELKRVKFKMEISCFITIG